MRTAEEIWRELAAPLPSFDALVKSYEAPRERESEVVNEYLNINDTAALIALFASVEPKVVIEIGCNTGRTAKNILTALPMIEKYIAIDVPPDHKPTLLCQYSEVPANAGHHAAEDPRFFLLVREGGSQELGPQDLEPCDAVFIDGDHSEHAVTHDSNLARVLVRPGGVIVWHDYHNPGVEVTQAVDKLKNEGWKIDHVPNTWIAYMRIGGKHAAS